MESTRGATDTSQVLNYLLTLAILIFIFLFIFNFKELSPKLSPGLEPSILYNLNLVLAPIAISCLLLFLAYKIAKAKNLFHKA